MTTSLRPLDERVRGLLDVKPNSKTGWIPFLTARDIVELLGASKGPAYQDVLDVLDQFEAQGLVRSKLVTYGPSVEPRDQVTYSWSCAIDHPGHRKWRQWAPRVAAQLEDLAKAGERLLGRS